MLANADRAPHVVDIARHTNIVLLAAISDAMGLDRLLARDFLYGLQLTGFVESSLMHREITRPDPSEHARDCSVLQQGAWRQMLFLEEKIRSSGPASSILDCQDLLTATEDQVSAGLLDGPFTRDEMLNRLCGSRVPKRDAAGFLKSPVCSLRFPVRQ